MKDHFPRMVKMVASEHLLSCQNHFEHILEMVGRSKYREFNYSIVTNSCQVLNDNLNREG